MVIQYTPSTGQRLQVTYMNQCAILRPVSAVSAPPIVSLLKVVQSQRIACHITFCLIIAQNQIKSIFVYLMEKVPRLSQTQRWFTEYYSVDSVTATDMRNLNKVKKILSFEFSIYGSGDKVSIVLFRE